MPTSAAVLFTVAALASLALAATGESLARPGPAVELDDPTIVAIFDAANTADIETGALAAERGQAKEVREFGAMLTRDHAFHKAVIDAVQTKLLPAIRNAELRALVVKVAPAFEAHMLAAQSLEKQLATTTTR